MFRRLQRQSGPGRRCRGGVGGASMARFGTGGCNYLILHEGETRVSFSPSSFYDCGRFSFFFHLFCLSFLSSVSLTVYMFGCVHFGGLGTDLGFGV